MTKKIFKGSLWDVEGIIKADKRVRTIDYVLISVGVNDIDTKSATEVNDQVQKVVELIKSRYGNPRIVLAELTPRHDDRDSVVKECNSLINAYIDATENVFGAKLSTLRTDDWRHYHDEKHITNFAIPIYCANLKRALRAAYANARAGFQQNTNVDRIRGRGRGRGRGGYNHNRGGNFNNSRGGSGYRGGRDYRGGGYRTNNQGQGFSSRADLEHLIREIVGNINAAR